MELKQSQILKFEQYSTTPPTRSERKAAAKERRRIAKAERSRKKVAPLPIQKSDPYVASNSFLNSYEWRKLRMGAIKLYGRRCMCCGAHGEDVIINVDHIKPRKLFPALALDVRNLQILCEPCNHGKGNWDHTDWRSNEDKERLLRYGEAPLTEDQKAHLMDILRGR